MICKKCDQYFKSRYVLENGKIVILNNNRKFCVKCSPYKPKNIESIEVKHEWQKSARKKRKKELIDLMGGKCSICGYSKCNAALEFHHIDPKEKKFNLSSMGYVCKWERLVDEAKKCILVCSNCHKEIEENIINSKELKVTNFLNVNYYSYKKHKEIILVTKEEVESIIKEKGMFEASKYFCISQFYLIKFCKNNKISLLFKDKDGKIYSETFYNNVTGKYSIKNKFEISKEELEKLIKEKPFTQIGKMFGVTDNAIRKKCKKYGIETKVYDRGYWLRGIIPKRNIKSP